MRVRSWVGASLNGEGTSLNPGAELTVSALSERRCSIAGAVQSHLSGAHVSDVCIKIPEKIAMFEKERKKKKLV